MIRAKVEQIVGKLSDAIWEDTCTIVTVDLIIRRKHRLNNDMQDVLLLCVGVADAINKGYIRKGIA